MTRKAVSLDAGLPLLIPAARPAWVARGRGLLSTAAVVGFVATMVALGNEMLTWIDVGPHYLLVIAYQWLAALAMPALRARSVMRLLWFLHIEGLGLAYQVVLLQAGGDDAPIFVLVGPTLLAGALWLFSGIHTLRRDRGLALAWILLNVPGLAVGVLSPILDAPTVIFLFLLAVVLPAVVGAIARDAIAIDGRAAAEDVVATGFMVAASVSVLLIPFELAQRDSDSVAALQYGGRAYVLIGVLFLLWPVLLRAYTRWSRSRRAMGVALVLLLVGSSFSRGAIAIFILLIGLSLTSRQRGYVRTARKIAAGGALVGGLSVWLLPQAFGGAGRFWLLRLNVVSNYPGASSGLLSNLFDTSRVDIWAMAIDLIARSPLLGHGLGATSVLLEIETGGLVSFSGMHNLLLTVGVERGLVGLFGVGFLFLRILRASWREPERWIAMCGLIAFLAFALVTGVELFLNGSRVVNATVSLFLFVTVALYEAPASGPRQ